MGTGNLINQTDGESADAADVQQIIDSLKEDVVPRASSGIPTDAAGSIGTSSFRWLTGYIKKLFLGTDLSIEQSGDFAILKQSTTELQRMGARPISTDGTNPGANGVVISAAVSAVTTSSSYIDVSGLSVTLTTTGRPIFVGLLTDSTGGRLTCSGGIGQTFVAILRGTTVITSTDLNTTTYVPSGSLHFIDTGVTAGTYTYKVQHYSVGGSATSTIYKTKLMAYEI